MSDAVTVLGELDELSSSLDETSKMLYIAQGALDEMNEIYEELFDDELALMHEESEGKRLPGEDVRKAVITRKIKETSPELYAKHRKLEREVRRTKHRAENLESSISAKQSILSYLKVEAQAIR